MTYVCNFKPSINDFNGIDNYLFKPIKTKRYVICRNFFLFFLFLKNSQISKSVVSIFIKPRKQGHNTILRAPYRYKLGRYQIGYNRYYVVLNTKLPLKATAKLNIKDVKNFYCLCKSFYPWLDSNLITQYKTRIEFYNTFKKHFCITNYKN